VSFSKTSNSVHAGRDIFGNAFISGNLAVLSLSRCATEQAVEAGPVLFLETRLEIFEKTIPADLFLKNLPVFRVVVYLFNGVKPKQLLLACIFKQVHASLVYVFYGAIF